MKKLASRWRETRGRQLALSSSLEKIRRLLEKSGLFVLNSGYTGGAEMGHLLSLGIKALYYLAHQNLGHSRSSLYQAKDIAHATIRENLRGSRIASRHDGAAVRRRRMAGIRYG